MSGLLAIEGGSPSVPEHLVAHNWERFRKSTQEEIDAVVAVLKSGHLSIAQGSGMPQAESLEGEFAEWVGAKHCLVVNSGTAALHCAVVGLGVEPGDQVIVPSHTFVASAMVVLYQNAAPVFVDINPETYLMDPGQIEAKITDKTKAIMPVHLYGLPCDMDPINDIARKYGLGVIEDSAQSYGAVYKGKKTGVLGDAAAFAMTTTKQLMVGEGGLLATSNDEIYERASMLRLFGERGSMRETDRAYMSEAIGWNYKLAEVCSALARVKLRHLDEFISTTQRNAAHLTEKLQEIKGVIPPKVPPGRTHTYYLYSVQVDADKLNLQVEPGKLRDAAMWALAAENVQVFRWQKAPVPAQPLFQNKVAYGRGCPWSCHGGEDVSYDVRDYPNTVAILENSFTMRGFIPPNDIELMDCYAAAFEKVFQNIDRVVDLYDKSHT